MRVIPEAKKPRRIVPVRRIPLCRSSVTEVEDYFLPARGGGAHSSIVNAGKSKFQPARSLNSTAVNSARNNLSARTNEQKHANDALNALLKEKENIRNQLAVRRKGSGGGLW
ncbi:hypothetical protein MAX20_29010, partial [Escherichia coli]